ncbi:PucR family transcriptional regulator [Nocardia brasiliensis]
MPVPHREDAENTTAPDAVLDRLHAFAAALISEFTVGAAPYDQLSPTLMDADFRPGAELNVDLFFEFARTGVEPSEAETQPLVDRAVGLVRQGMELTEAMTNYRLGVSFLWSQLIQKWSAEQEQPLPAALPFQLNDYLGLVTTRIAAAVVEDIRQPRWDIIERHREIADALLNGRDPVEWATGQDIAIAAAFLIAVVRLGDPSPGSVTLLRNTFHAMPGAFLRRDGGGWTALIPYDTAVEEDAAVSALAAQLTAISAGRPQLWIGVAAAVRHADIPAAYAEAQAVAEVARSTRWPELVCRRQAMMFEYLVATAKPARTALVGLLEPLAEQPVLRETLGLFIDRDFNQNAVAREMFVHRNTITYRLNRVAELTGLDPQRPSGIATLMAARIAESLGMP